MLLPRLSSGDLDENLLFLEFLYVEYDACVNDHVALGVHRYFEPVEWSRGGAGEIDPV